MENQSSTSIESKEGMELNTSLDIEDIFGSEKREN
jgi:hypothetical protein